MKRRIHIELLVTSGLAILLTLTFAMFVFYGLFRSQIIRDLETDARVMKNMGVFDDISRMAEKNGSISSEDLRITVVSPGGDVLFDSSADAAAMENHEDRPEIRTALEAGEGSGSRRSETMDKNLFYYAVRMENGNVLRISREADSFFAVFQNFYPIILQRPWWGPLRKWPGIFPIPARRWYTGSWSPLWPPSGSSTTTS